MNAKERALKHRQNIGKFFKLIGNGVVVGVCGVKDNVLKPTGTYIKHIVIGERDIQAEQEQLIRERLLRFQIPEDSLLYQRLLKRDPPPTEDELAEGLRIRENVGLQPDAK